MVSASEDNTLGIWDLASGRELRSLSGHTDDVWAVAVTPDGLRAVSASEDQTLKVWDLESGRDLLTLAGHASLVRAVVVTPDGKHAVSASFDSTLRIWDLETGDAVATFNCDSGAVCCAYSDALKLIVAGDVTGRLHFLRLEEPNL